MTADAMGRRSGFSLIELVVSTAVLLLVMTFLLQIFTVQQKTYVVVDQVTESQQNLRAVTDLIERDVRRAGFMVPPHAAVCGYDATTAADTLFVSNADAIQTVFQLEGGAASLGGNFGAPVSGVTAAWNATGSGFALTLSRLWVDVAADGDDFFEDGGVIVVNRNDEDEKVACGLITDKAGNTLTVDFGGTGTGPVGLNADVVAIPAYVYTLIPAAGNTPSQLRRNGVLLANDVEDLQVSYFFDLNDDLVVDAGEYFAAAGGTADPYALPTTTFPGNSLLREVQVNLVTVTRGDDPNTAFTIGAGQATANRTAGSLPSGDGKRRRVHTARVRLRNS
jgi:prepilin-type N-terminal cleavage/methylation domain-containing protein